MTNKQIKPKLFSTPIIIWYSIIITGFIVAILHLLSSVFVVIGFAGLTALSIGQITFVNNKNWLNVLNTILGAIFLFVLIGGALLFNGHPINFKGVIIYFMIFIPTLVYLAIKYKIKK